MRTLTDPIDVLEEGNAIPSTSNCETSTFWDFLDKAKQQEAPENQFEKKMKQYLAEATIDRKLCPLVYWKEKRQVFPVLSVKAQFSLGIPITAVPSERHWSDAGNTITTRRESLNPETFRELVFLRNCLK